MVISLHQYFQTRERVIRVDRNGNSAPFPNAEMSSGLTSPESRSCSEISLDSVMGIRAGSSGVMWMLDNGRRGECIPKVVGWNANSNSVHQLVYLPSPATTENSFLADMAISPDNNFVYIADPASGNDAALIVVDLRTGMSRRLLQGHVSVVPEDIPLVIQGRRVEVRRADGSSAEPLAGVNPIALGRKGKWLYYGPLKGRRLYRVDTEVLQDFGRSPEEVASAVEEYSFKPICDSIAIDHKNSIYAADLTRQAIVVIRPEGESMRHRKPEVYLQDPQLSWPDGLAFGPDQRLYFYCSQIDRTPWFNGGEDHTQGPFRVYRVKPIHHSPLLSNPLQRKGRLSELGEQLSERFGRDE